MTLALACRLCGTEADAAVSPDAVAFTCARCLMLVKPVLRAPAGEGVPDPAGEAGELALGGEELIRSGRASDGRRVELWRARGSYQGALPYFAVLGYQADETRTRQGRYTPAADYAEVLYQDFLGYSGGAVGPPAIPKPHEWLTVRARIIARDHGRCRKCRARNRLTVHHIRPRADGGLDKPANLLTLCARCHDWAELETAERGLGWAELIAPPEGA